MNHLAKKSESDEKEGEIILKVKMRAEMLIEHEYVNASASRKLIFSQFLGS